MPDTYKVIVFGAGWCESCEKELPQLETYVDYFKENYDTQIIYVAIDTDLGAFKTQKNKYSFISTCEYKGWNGENVKNYYVTATPSIFIVDREMTIVAKPSYATDAARWLSVTTQKKSPL